MQRERRENERGEKGKKYEGCDCQRRKKKDEGREKVNSQDQDWLFLWAHYLIT